LGEFTKGLWSDLVQSGGSIVRQVNIHEAKTHLSALVDAAAAGEQIILARAGKPIAMLSALPPNAPRRRGVLAGQITVAPDFDAPLPEPIVRAFEGKE
jgi:antitoxin (DNA-binding transcriptional repressor) of toxin-antitoxin stability system